MPRSRKEKRQHSDSAPEQRARILKGGGYNGSGSSRDFMVSGHSTGSQNSEMEALSHQVSMDAGRVPDYPIDQSDGNFQFSRRDKSESKEIAKKSVGTDSRYTIGKIIFGMSVGAIGGALSYLAYRYYSSSSDESEYSTGYSTDASL